MARRPPTRAGEGSTRHGPVPFLLRLPADLHRRLAVQAAAEDASLNEYCVQRLAGPDVMATHRRSIAAVLATAAVVAGTHLVGVIAHGSWVRGEARDSSDVDVMVVVARSLPLTRDLYREWDASSPAWDGRPVDAHFVHLPDAARGPGSLWCELAVEGVVLDDRSGAVSATLIEVRRAIAQGRFVRKTAHGQPYWTEAA
ncbi:hypothetical protein TBR22_A51300 [Luteitalea sp. TBR-22]|uniref:toxin-antitoxin system HicB family antitoxin n=1 Tax=Luteitalea sp. TBR-22 TaxID=2802971 RepID=UPI001AF87485|nr:toxin-antitoxin system HicB family antitoxin [Luteitalea sp. TBR-22]BCS35895.1 hypothetical protein TBR22_A51300 [Luteitalea sp. TBR-22]